MPDFFATIPDSGGRPAPSPLPDDPGVLPRFGALLNIGLSRVQDLREFGESAAASMQAIPGDIAKGFRETVEDYHAPVPRAVETGSLGRTIVGPAYRAARAIGLGPLGQAAFESQMGTGIGAFRGPVLRSAKEPVLEAAKSEPEPALPQESPLYNLKVETIQPPPKKPQIPPGEFINPVTAERGILAQQARITPITPGSFLTAQKRGLASELGAEIRPPPERKIITAEIVDETSVSARDVGVALGIREVAGVAPAGEQKRNMASEVRSEKGPSSTVGARQAPGRYGPHGEAAAIGKSTGLFGRDATGRITVRQQAGLSARALANQQHLFEGFHRMANKMTPKESRALIAYMQRRSSGVQISDPQFQALADEIRESYQDLAYDLQDMQSAGIISDFDRMQFERDHFRQLWQDPREGDKFYEQYVSREGEKAVTKDKEYPTFEDGLAAGLRPKSWNVLDVAMHDMANQRKMITMARIREEGVRQGFVKMIGKGKRLPYGWRYLDGWGADRGAYNYAAQAGFAKNYNAYVGHGLYHMEHGAGELFQFMRRAQAAATAFELAMSAYHGLSISKEAVHSTLTQAAYQLMHGRPFGAAKELVKTISGGPLGPIPYYLYQGHRAGKIWLGTRKSTEFNHKIVDALAQVHADMGHIDPIYLSGTGVDLVKALQRGSVGKSIRNSLSNIRNADGALRTLGTTVEEAADAAGAVLDTTAKPLFQIYIPMIKRGVLFDNLATWAKARPNANWNEILNEAAYISDTVDERFGLMMQDNLFWNPHVKHAAQIAMRSASWSYGAWMQYAGGVRELDPRLLRKQGFGRRSAYLFGSIFGDALIGGMITYLATGKTPKDIADYFLPRSGGTVGERHPGGRKNEDYRVPERFLLPGNAKDVIDQAAILMDATIAYQENRNWRAAEVAGVRGFSEYLRNKEADLWANLFEEFTGKDWSDNMLVNPRDPPPGIRDFFAGAWQRFGPISLKQDKPKTGSSLGLAGQLGGIRPAARRWVDPKGYREMMRDLYKRDKSIAASRARHHQAEQSGAHPLDYFGHIQ